MYTGIAGMAALAVVVVGPQHPALTTDRDLTPGQKTLSAKGEVKSVKLAPGDILGDSPLAQRFEDVYRPLADDLMIIYN